MSFQPDESFIATNIDSGPLYPAMPALNRYRGQAARAGSIAAMPRAEVEAYAAAINAQIRALNNAAQRTTRDNPRPSCASGCWHSDGAAISEHIRRRQIAELYAGAAHDRRARTDNEIRKAYKDAMADKREREAAAALHVERATLAAADAMQQAWTAQAACNGNGPDCPPAAANVLQAIRSAPARAPGKARAPEKVLGKVIFIAGRRMRLPKCFMAGAGA